MRNNSMNQPGIRYTGTPAKWDTDGNAENVEAALCDALQWMMHSQQAGHFKQPDNQAELNQCIEQAKRFVGNEQMSYRKT